MAYKLSMKQKNILVVLHVISVAAWFGATLCMLLLLLYVKKAENGEQLYYILESMHILDDNLIKYPALLTLFTGVLLSLWTHWGIAKYYWVVVKLILTIVTILLGIFFINDWFAYLLSAAKKYGFAAVQRQDFQSIWLANVLAAIFNNAAYGFMMFITYFKPFGKIRKTPGAKS
ncbi:hypothetical protein ACFQI7_35100 [Paenibacillus allorhizosphaerae]|uniref:DUF2269 family protein n=1 Tax=Paenibacillus allorhizosphaerae TaxID=2849866 RepID=A0ABM8VTH2_9BACL|nr:hypothetical protein [Paenibacillus allorhizosphaerae]CAG7657543.1 hypothetical protein PAECIP111802_06767 [Paenibacillus allorhizosphaerae]